MGRALLHQVRRNRFRAGVDSPDRSRGGSGLQGIDENDSLRIGPELHQGKAFSGGFADLQPRQFQCSESPNQDPTHRIIAAKLVADPDEHRLHETPGLAHLLAVDLEEMSRAGDAGIVVADRLFAVPLEFIIRQVDVLWNESIEIPLDCFLVL